MRYLVDLGYRIHDQSPIGCLVIMDNLVDNKEVLFSGTEDDCRKLRTLLLTIPGSPYFDKQFADQLRNI